MARPITKKAPASKKQNAGAAARPKKQPLSRSFDEYVVIAERLERLLRLDGLYIARSHPECSEAAQRFWNGLHGPTIIEGRRISHDMPPMPSLDELHQAAEVVRFVAGALADPQFRMHIVAKMHAETHRTRRSIIGRFVQIAVEVVESYRIHPSPGVIESFLAGVASLDPRLAAQYEAARDFRREARERGEREPPMPADLAWLTELFDATLRKANTLEPVGLAARVALTIAAFDVDPKTEDTENLTNAYRNAWRRWTG